MATNIDWLDILDWNEDHLNDLRFIGYYYIKQGHYDTAIKYFEALCLLASSTYDLQTMGALYLQKGNYVKALNYIEQSLKKNSEHLPTKMNRVKALFALGYKNQAIEQAKELLKCDNIEIASQASALLLANE